MSREHQKFYAFIGLMLCILGMALISIFVSAVDKNGQATDPTVLQAKLAILNMAMGGLVAGFGAAAQAFFRHSQVDADNAAASKAMAESLPSVPQPVVVTNVASDPVPTTTEPAPTVAPWERENA